MCLNELAVEEEQQTIDVHMGSTEIENQLLGLPLNKSHRFSSCEELVKNDSKILRLAH